MSIQFFNNAQTGAPQLDKSAGSLVALLDACLVDGFGSVTMDSISVSSGVATATLSTGHGIAMFGTLSPWIVIAGATPSALNGTTRVTVTSASQFTFATTAADGTATGTITAKKAPLGWSKAFSGTNKAAYRSNDITGPQFYLRVDDGYDTYIEALIAGYESMSDIDTGTDRFPTSAQSANGLYMFKSNAAAGTYRSWWLIGDGSRFYLIADPLATMSSYYIYGAMFFGRVNSFASEDAYNTLIVGGPSSSQPGGLATLASSGVSGMYLARSAGGSNKSYACGRHSHKGWGSTSSGGEVYPTPVGELLKLAIIEVWDGSLQSRGIQPGQYALGHTFTAGTAGAAFFVALVVNGRTYVILPMATSSYVGAAFDLTGPWE